jgi:hypothetical protein
MSTQEELAAAQARITTAQAKYTFPWWESNDPTILTWHQLNEPILLVEFSKFHHATEMALGRPVWTHEFANVDSLKAEFQNKIPKATFEDVVNKVTKPVIIVTT